ncbi:unnamed protein product [Prorocentrum cordatum]|uniref:KHDC4/BBP-like KH-domain type I domain-containing protein n=1 Tax=Prorocentrum cordatum TaxID=2364126 RepID=A0ABN9V6N6_9DINO|nr:unnamed protein product [Polarella glacialis]
MKRVRLHRGIRHYWGIRVRGQHTKTTGRHRDLLLSIGYVTKNRQCMHAAQKLQGSAKATKGRFSAPRASAHRACIDAGELDAWILPNGQECDGALVHRHASRPQVDELISLVPARAAELAARAPGNVFAGALREQEEEKEEDAEKGVAEPQIEASCGAASRDLDAASDCSTSADDGLEPLRERCAELPSDEEDAAQPAVSAAAPAASEKGRAARRRAARAEERAAPKQRGAAPRGKAAAQWPAAAGAWADSGAAPRGRAAAPWQAAAGAWADAGAAWGPPSRAWQGKESWGAWGRQGSWKDAAHQPRQQRRQGAAGAGGKRQCQFTIGIEEEPKFRVVRRLIGEHGKHVKRIAEASGGAKLRLRGRGSGFLEGPEQEESGDPLMMCVSAPDERSYAIAVQLLREHLEDVYQQHRAANPGAAVLRVSLHEGPREGSY